MLTSGEEKYYIYLEFTIEKLLLWLDLYNDKLVFKNEIVLCGFGCPGEIGG